MNRRWLGLQPPICLIGAGLLLAGCTTDKVVGRYTSAICVEPDSQPVPCHSLRPTAEVSVTSVPSSTGPTTIVTSLTPPTPGTSTAPAGTSTTGPSAAAPSSGGAAAPGPLSSATNFPDRALTEYLKIISDKSISPTLKALQQNLAAPLKPTPDATPVEDRTLFNRVLLVTVAKEPPFNPADRIAATEVRIKPDGAHITAWDSAATMFTAINAGSIQLTQARGGSEGLALGAPSGAPITAGLTASATQTDTRQENFSALSQVDNLTVSVENGEIVIRRQGDVGIDLTGNTLVKIEVALDAQRIENHKPIFSIAPDLVDKNGDWLPASKVQLKAQYVRVPNAVAPVKATVQLRYTLRHVISGDNTIEESDDRVEEDSVERPAKQIDLIPAAQVTLPSYGLWTASDYLLYVTRPQSAVPEALCFDSFETAQSLLVYLQKAVAAHPSSIGTASLETNETGPYLPLSPGKVTGLVVHSGCQ